MKKVIRAFAGATFEGEMLDRSSQLPDSMLAENAQLDWRGMGMPHANVLLVGTDRAVSMILESMFVNFVEPIVACGPVDRFELPSPDAGGTVIIYHVDALTAEQQLRLIEWLEQNRGRAQVVSTTAHAILPRLQAGLFSDTLYYRLNTIRLNASSEPDRFN